MVIFPGIVAQLGGITSAKYQSKAQTQNAKNLNNALESQFFTIQFTVPLQQADSETVVKSPKIQLNKTKETKGSQSTWKSPLIEKFERKLKQMNNPAAYTNNQK